ncbi:hypothetical protein PENSPDRAFT_422395 [Peniophora sp. CONT]|nr:hypothetical protein PENSPDRAFT_422395 [Peniophora sp. CONT]
MPRDFTYLDLAGDWESLIGPRVIDNNNKRGDCDRYIAEPCSPAGPFSDPPSAATFTFFQPPALSIPSDSSDSMDSMPVSFPSLLTMNLTAVPRPASPTDSITDSSDSDYSPPQTPVDLEPIPFLTHEDIDFGDKLPPPLLQTRNVSHEIRLDTCSAPPDDELFAPPPTFAIPPGLNAASAAWLAMLCRREAYLYPSSVAATTVCVYDPSWHEDSLRGYQLPRVTVTGCAEDPDQWFENAAECDEGPCWDHLMAPTVTFTGRMSLNDEEFYYPYPIPDASCEDICEVVEEPEVPDCNSYEARWRGASLQELEDELAKQKVLVEQQRIGADGMPTYVPQRVEGRQWLWKNF